MGAQPDRRLSAKQLDYPFDPKAKNDQRRMELLNLDDLEIDRSVQRDTTTERAQRIGNEWDWALGEALTVTPLGTGKYRVEEGQHRVLAARSIGIQDYWCVVLPLSMSKPSIGAGVGLNISTGRRGHTALDRWGARVVEGKEHEVRAVAVLERYGLRLGRTPSAQTIASVDAVSSIVHGRRADPATGADLLDTVLHIVTGAWPEYDHESRASRFDHRIMRAVAEVAVRNPDLDRHRLATKLHRKQAMRWINDVAAAMQRPTTESIAKGMIEDYNQRLAKSGRGRLQWTAAT
jgi:hypothetical protein